MLDLLILYVKRVCIPKTENCPAHHNHNLYSKYNTLRIPDLHRQQILLFVHKFIHRKKIVYQVYLLIILYRTEMYIAT